MIKINNKTIDDIPSLLENFLNYTRNIKGQSPKTVSEYFFDLRTFLRFLKLNRGLVENNIDEFQNIYIKDIDADFLKEVTLTELYEYLSFTIDERHNANNTRARKISSLRSFFKYLTNKVMVLSFNPTVELEMPRLKKSLPKYLTLEQSKELLNSIDGINKERDFCILVLLLNCGMRLSELVGLNITDIRSDSTIRITGKGNKERILYLNDACITAIKNYLSVRPKDNVRDKDALFISRLKKRLGNRSVQMIVEKYIDKIGLGNQGYSVHKLRHTAATLMYQHGNVDILVLKEILGHENVGTTSIYTHLSNKELQQASKANPLSSLDKIKK